MKIFLMAGTEDGRKLAEFLSRHGHEVTASVVSEYGRKLLEQHAGISINDRKLDAGELAKVLRDGNFEAVVDASHPYAVGASQNAVTAADMTKTSYIRFERLNGICGGENVYRVDGYEAAAIKAAELGRNIYLTIGSRNLKTFVEAPALKDCIITARILPTAEVLAECERLGLTPKQIVAMQGPFSTELNVELFKHAGAEVIVTKDSGKIGGADTKIAAAEILKLPAVIIDRPKVPYPRVAATFEEILRFVEAQSSRM